MILGYLRLPTRGECKVILFTAAVFCFTLGTIAIVAGVRAPAEKQLLAHQAIFYGVASLFFSIVFFICLWLLCRFSDRS
jgi:hypothetical protein